MKTNVVIMAFQTLFMSVSQVFYIVWAVVLMSNSQSDPMRFFICGIVASALAMIFAAIVFLRSVIGIFRPGELPTRYVLVLKLLHVPFYIVNFFLWFVFISGLLNPMLFLAVPVCLAIATGITYLFMLSSGVPNVSYVIGGIKDKKIKASSALVVACVFHFVFVLDVIGALMLHIELKKQLAELDNNAL